jgi:hypothetical protein
VLKAGHGSSFAMTPSFAAEFIEIVQAGL